MKYQVGDKVTMKHGECFKKDQPAEIIAILERPDPFKEPCIVVRAKGGHGEFVAQVFEKDIIPPKPTVVAEGWTNYYPAQSMFGGYLWCDSQLAKSAAGTCIREHLRIYKLSDGTWHVEADNGSQG